MSQTREQEVLGALSTIIDPDFGKDIVSCGFIKDLKIIDGQVSFKLELTTPACPIKESFRQQAQEALTVLPWVNEVSLELTSRAPQSRRAGREVGGLTEVKRIIGVSSCKGGVGKSTVAVNLAYALAQSGAKVGLLDADIYGPSLPTLVDLEVEGLTQSNDLIDPLEWEGVKLMSFGYASSPNKAAIMRGPMVSSVVNQLSVGTNWGPLDYLVVDLPPGTGDIQLTLTQRLNFDGAVIVTTPQTLSLVDVVKGLEMFAAVNVPTLGVVENMSYFVCDDCNKKHYPFGKGAKARLAAQYGIENTFELPLLAAVSAQCDRGVPAVLDKQATQLAASFRHIAGTVVQTLEQRKANPQVAPTVTFEADKGIVVADDQHRGVIAPAELRRACGCASCKDEFSGKPILNPESVSADITPLSIDKVGNYAVAINWSDGHTSSIYPYNRLRELAF